MSRHQDISGQKYGRLLAIDYIRTDKSRCAIWKWRCDCGKETEARASSVKHGDVKSCGCLHSENSSNRIKKLRLPSGVAASNELYGTYRNSARKRGLSFNLSLEEFLRLTKGDCTYCGTPPSGKTKYRTNGSYTYSGLDRVENKLGYESGNVVSCCRQCNMAKRNLPLSTFLEWAKRVASKG